MRVRVIASASRNIFATLCSGPWRGLTTIWRRNLMASSSPSKIESELHGYCEEIERIAGDARKLEGLSDTQFNWIPAPGCWSIAQCMSHLNVVTAIDLPMIAAEIEKAKVAGKFESGPYRYGFVS